MSRETKEIKIGKHTLVLYTYASGREVHAINTKLTSSVNMEVDTFGKPQMKNVDLSAVYQGEYEKIRLLVVSIDGISNDDKLDVILDLPKDEYEEVINALNELTDEKQK